MSRGGWFGEPWPSGVCEDPESQRHEVPIGKLCLYCEEEILAGDRGIVYVNGPVSHRECAFRSVMGSLAHLEGRCSCFVPGSSEGDPPGMSRREGALAAWDWFQKGDGVDGRADNVRDIEAYRRNLRRPHGAA